MYMYLGGATHTCTAAASGRSDSCWRSPGVNGGAIVVVVVIVVVVAVVVTSA